MSCLVIGEALIDEIHGLDGHTRRIPGGSMLNVAIGLRRLGRTVRLVTDFGHDPDGKVLSEYCASNGLELWLRTSKIPDLPTSVAHVTVEAGGDVNYDLDFQWDIQDTPFSGACKLDLEVLAPNVLAFGSFSALIAPGAEKVRNWVEELRPTATICYDPNVRSRLIEDLHTTQKEVEGFVRQSDVVKVSTRDLQALYDADVDADAMARAWLDLGPSLIALTQGAEGAVMYSASGMVLPILAPYVDVVDTVGAGAAFFSALIDGLSRISLSGAEYRHNLRTIGLTNLETLGAYAATAAAITVGRPGANPPTREELIDQHEYYQASRLFHE